MTLVHSQKKPRKIAVTITIIIIFSVVLGFLNNVSTKITESDISVFDSNFPEFKNLHLDSNFDNEVKIIEVIQRAVFERVQFGSGIPIYSAREPVDVLSKKTGLCFDRSRVLEKMFKWIGFETRHVYLLYKPDFAERSWSLWYALLAPYSKSHAVTEVKTSRGWLMVDTRDKWISINKKGELIPIEQIHERNDEFLSQPPEGLKHPFWVIRGLYARRGQLYPPFLPYPQLNWWDFYKYQIKE